VEIFGILFSIPASFVASLVYCLLLAKFVVRLETVSRLMWHVSAAVLIAFSAEVLLLVTLGAVRARGLIGPAFYAGHIVLFLLGTPALANVLLLRRSPKRGVPWYAAVPFCVAFAFVLVLLQYSVAEALYGIDGDNGPFSAG
jgi:hypothetical protein